MPSHLLVERALALVPDCEEFLPLRDAVIGTSRVDREKMWDRSSAYATLGKRVVDAARLEELVPRVVERAQQRLREIFSLVAAAIREQQAGDLAAAAQTLVRAGEMEEADRHLDRAEKIYTMALEVADGLRDRAPQILALRRLGRTLRAAGRLDEAWGWYERSYELACDEGDVAGQAIACQGLGNLCDDRGHREHSRFWNERGLRLAVALDSPSLEWPFHNNLAVLAMLRGELAEAEEILARSRSCIEAAGEPGALPFWYNNRGLLLTESGDAAGAEAAFREALEGGPDPWWEMTILVNLGHALVRQDRLFEAEEEARRAEEIAIVGRFIPDLVDVYELLGELARNRCDEEGFVFYEQALRVCRERDLPAKTVASVHHGYGRLHAACGRPAEARAYLELARETFQSLGMPPEVERVESALDALEKEATAA